MSIDQALARWHRIVLERDVQALEELLAENVVFHSPFLGEPYTGRETVLPILAAVSEVFQGLTYHRELVEGQSCALEFSARVDDQLVKGIDLIRLDEAGRIVEFEVFVRPFKGLRALGMAMAKRLG